jgi:hypothetical protein
MVDDLNQALQAFQALVERRDPRSVEVVTRVFDWRMRSLDETGEISTDESERLTTNCDRFLTEAGQYLQERGEAAKSFASDVVDHIARFLLQCEKTDRAHPLIGVAEALGICFTGSLAKLRSARDAVRGQKPRTNEGEA